jgi:hypothetical protein
MPATMGAHTRHFRTSGAKSARSSQLCVSMSILFSHVQFAWVFKVEGLPLSLLANFFLDALVCPRTQVVYHLLSGM